MPRVPKVVTDCWHVPARRKWLLRAAAAGLLYSLLGFLAVPAVLKWQLLKQLPALTYRQAAVRQVACNPFALSLTIRGLALTETNNHPFASFEEFHANFQLSSLFRWAWTFDTVRLSEPRVEVVLGKDGRFNFANLLESTNPPPPRASSEPPSVPSLLVFSLVVTNGNVGFADLTRKTPFRTTYAPINLNLTGFTTRKDRESPYSFEAAGDGGRSVSWSGTVTAQPLGSSGALKIQGFQFPRHSPYIEDFTRAQLADGTLDVAGSYRFGLATNGLDLVVSNLTATVSNLQLKDPDTSETVLSVPTYEMRNAALDLRAREAYVAAFSIKDARAFLRRRPDGSINIPSLILTRITSTAPPTPPAATQPWVFTLGEYRLDNATVEFEDAMVPGPFRTVLKPLNVRVDNFSTRTNAEAALLAESTTEASEQMRFTARYSLHPAQGSASLALTNIHLAKYQPYLKPFFRGQLTSGTADVSLDVQHAYRGATHDAAVSNLVVRIAGLEVKSPEGQETVLALPRFSVENASARLADQAIRIAAIRSEDATIAARRELDGALNLVNLLAATNTAAPTPPQASTGASNAAPPTSTSSQAPDGWRVLLDELALRNYAIHLDDRQTKAGKLALDQIALTLRDAQFPSNAPVRLDFSARLNGTGTLATRGTVLPYSPAADVEVGVTNVQLPDFQPWADAFVNFGLTSGTLGTSGRFRLAAPNGPGPKLAFTGGVTLANLAAKDHLINEEFVRCAELAVHGIDLGADPTHLTVEQVRLAGLNINVIRTADQQLNLLSVLPRAATNPPPQAPPATSAPAPGTATNPPVKLGELKLDQISLHLEDQSIEPPCRFEVRRIDGTVKGLSSEPDARAEVGVSGKIDEASPFGLHGTINPLAGDLTLHLAFTNQNLQLTPFSTYLAKYAGHPLNRGRLSLDLAYTVHQGQLQASNLIRVDQLMLGQRNNSPDATKLPVKLAVALLKDVNGRIELDVPVAGKLNDPEFKIFPIVAQVIGNLIVKAATSPFKLLGALVGGGEELSFVEFSPGLSEMRAGETNKLDKLIKALEGRPAVNLEIDGSADPGADRDALARQMVQARVKSLRLEELTAISQAPSEADSFQPDPADQERILRGLVTQAYATNLTAAIQALGPRAATTNTSTVSKPAAGAGLLAPVTRLFKSREERAALAQSRRQAKADAELLKQSPELASLTLSDMETLLLPKTDVPADRLRQLMQDRAGAVRSYLQSVGHIADERLFIVPPKTPDAAFQGAARANLSLN